MFVEGHEHKNHQSEKTAKTFKKYQFNKKKIGIKMKRESTAKYKFIRVLPHRHYFAAAVWKSRNKM